MLRSHHNKKLSPFLLFPLTLFLLFLLWLPLVNAKEAPNRKPQPWQINGIIAALDDSAVGVKKKAFDQLNQYKAEDLKRALSKPEQIAQKAFNILKDKNADSSVRYSAAVALGNLGDAAKPYIKHIIDFLKDKNLDSSVRDGAESALKNLGDAAKPYVNDILDTLKDQNADSRVRSSAAVALGNLGDAAKPYVKDIADILEDKNADSSVRSGAAKALVNLDDAAKPYVKDILDFLKDQNVDQL